MRAGSALAPSVATWQSTRIQIPGQHQLCVATEGVVEITLSSVHTRAVEWSVSWEVSI
jgi:hypothetical protein